MPGLEKQQILVRPGFVKGVVHIPFPGYPVKQLGIAGQLNARCRRTVGHEFFHTLLAVGRLSGPVVFGNFPPDTLYHIGKAPGGQLRSLHGNRNRAPGNIFIYQSNPSFQKRRLGTICPEVPLSFRHLLPRVQPFTLQRGSVNDFLVGGHLLPDIQLGHGENLVFIGNILPPGI